MNLICRSKEEVFKRSALLGLAIVSFTSAVNASPITDSLVNRNSFSYSAANSYDGPGRDTLNFFSSFTDGNLYRLDTITTAVSGQSFSAHLLSELACYDGNEIPSVGNSFGVVDSNGNFNTMIDSKTANPLSSGNFVASSSAFNFALKSPEGTFFSKDSLNVDGGAAHMLATKVTSDTIVNLPSSMTNLTNGAPVSFQLFSGDIILFIEDMLASGNIATGLIPFASDFDYNDMVVVIRASTVPEPTTLVLFGSAALGVLGRRRKQVSI